VVERQDFKRYLDMEDALKRLGGMKTIYTGLLRKFLENTAIADLQAAEQTGDATEISNAAHAIKGLAANLSLPALQTSASDLNAAIRDGEAPGALPKAVYDAWDKTKYVIEETLSQG
jgi:HPt (histidine-containing phosphotransfer) domain-containing protein